MWTSTILSITSTTTSASTSSLIDNIFPLSTCLLFDKLCLFVDIR